MLDLCVGERKGVLIREVSSFQGLNWIQELLLGERKGVHIREVSSFQGLNWIQELFLGERKGVHIREVSSFQGLNWIQELFLGERKGVHIREVSSFQGCPSIGVLLYLLNWYVCSQLVDCRVSWVRVPPRAAHFSLEKRVVLGVVVLFPLLCLVTSFFTRARDRYIAWIRVPQ